MRNRLLAIYDDIDRRTRAIRDAHPWWPCGRGCDACCRRLADIPRLVRAEWELFREGLVQLRPDVRGDVLARIEALGTAERDGRLPPDIICPMLDEGEGICRVYAHRPGTCRTFGFHVERGVGLHCMRVAEAVALHEETDDPVVWGNQEGVDHAIASLGDRAPRSLTTWISEDQNTMSAM